MDQNFVVCAFYTHEYEDEVLVLAESVKKYGYKGYFKKYSSFGKWELNVGIKPAFILHCLEKFTNSNILYIDADAVICGKLELFENIDEYYDIGIFFTKNYPAYSKSRKSYWSDPVLTGTIFFNNNEKSIRFLQAWVKKQESNVFQTDQKSFCLAMEAEKDIIFLELPIEYVKIFDIEKRGVLCSDPVITHFMSSRILEKKKLPPKVRKKKKMVSLHEKIKLMLGTVFSNKIKKKFL